MSQKTLPVRHKSFVQGLSHPRTCSKEMRNFLKWPEVSPATSFSKSLLKTSRKEGKRKKKGFSQTIPNKPLLEYVTVINVRIQNDAEV